MVSADRQTAFVVLVRLLSAVIKCRSLFFSNFYQMKPFSVSLLQFSQRMKRLIHVQIANACARAHTHEKKLNEFNFEEKYVHCANTHTSTLTQSLTHSPRMDIEIETRDYVYHLRH